MKNEYLFQQCNCVFYMYAHVHFVLSFNDFTKTVFMMRKDKENLFTESTVCV